ncbi:MAG: tripartite tricarboxylate transporter substrate-binding protein [bacterium]
MGPAGMPREVVARLHGEISRIVTSAETREVLAQQGAEPLTSQPEQFARFVEGEIAKLGKVVKASGARIQ